MALIINNKSKCVLCGNVIRVDDPVVAFPAFISNEADALFLFSDAAFHENCFHQHPLSSHAEECYKEFIERMSPGHRSCRICQQDITLPNDYLSIGLLSSDEGDPVYQYNYVQFHRSCLAGWSALSELYELLDRFQHSGKWKGKALEWLLNEMREYLS